MPLVRSLRSLTSAQSTDASGASIPKLSDPGVSIQGMDVAAVLLALLTLAAGVVIGLLYGRSRAEAASRLTVAAAEATGRDAVVRAETAARETLALAEAATHEARHEVARLCRPTTRPSPSWPRPG
jgi:hypothetical protein